MNIKLSSIVLGSALILAGCAGSNGANAPENQDACQKVAQYDIHFARIDETLQQIVHGTGCFVEYYDTRISALPAQPVTGKMTIAQAVAQATGGAPLKLEHPQNGKLTLKITR